MSKSSSVKLTFFLLIAAFVSVALCTADFSSVLAQNTNSSTTTEESGAQNSNSNGNMMQRGRRRGGRRSSRSNSNANMAGDANMAANENMSGGDNTNMQQDTNASGNMQDNTNMSMGRGRRRGRRGSRRGDAAMDANTSGDTTTTSGDQTDSTNTSGGSTGMAGGTSNTGGGESSDLSGTYTGKLSMPEHGINGEEGTLTITGNQYTLTAGSMTHSGRFAAVTTRGYTGAAMELGPAEAGQAAPQISVRARRSGANGLSLTSVPGETHKFSFMTAGASGGGRRSRRHH